MNANSNPDPLPGIVRGRSSVAVFGLVSLAIYISLAVFLVRHPWEGTDTENFHHWARANFAYASSPIDLSVISPFQGLGGLVQPLAVWLHPVYLAVHLSSWGEPRAWGFLSIMLLTAFATFFLGRATGLPGSLAAISAQIMAIFSFPPMWEKTSKITHWNGPGFYTHLEGFAVPPALAIILVAVFCYLGRLTPRKNLICVLLLPVLVLYSILCDPIYSIPFFVPAGFLLAGVFWGSGSKQVLRWRTVGAGFCLLACLALNLHNFYRALGGYAARAVFPNELYVEVQQWDSMTSLFFQGGLASIGIGVLIISCIIVVVYGSAQMKSFVASVLLFQFVMVAVSVFYVCSGVRWMPPLPVYLEMGAYPAYAVALFLGLSVFVERLKAAELRPMAARLRSVVLLLCKPVGVYIAVLMLPLLGIAWLLYSHDYSQIKPLADSSDEPKPATGIVKILEDALAIGADGQFRGSAVTLFAPGGDLLKLLGAEESDPFNKTHLNFTEGYGTTIANFLPDIRLTGLWNHRIPTLEDDNHLVTPPFHFLVSRVFSRPQDFHSRNWALITKDNPKLMATLGARFLVVDHPMSDPMLTERAHLDGHDVSGRDVKVYAYEIQKPNLGNLSPTQTVLSTNAVTTLRFMVSDAFNPNEVAVVHDSQLAGLTQADFGVMFYEKGGLRVHAQSRGRSLLVLPFQYSNSLRIQSVLKNSSGSPIKLLRVNLLQTGVLFDGEIEFKMAHVFGPFRGTKSRLRDIEDCRRLGIEETGTIPYPPDYQPLGKT